MMQNEEASCKEEAPRYDAIRVTQAEPWRVNIEFTLGGEVVHVLNIRADIPSGHSICICGVDGRIPVAAKR